MNIIIFGLNHRTAPIEIREKFFLNPTQQDLLLSELKSNPSIVEAFILSTCNRMEFYACGGDAREHFRTLIPHILQIKKLEYDPDLTKHFYLYENEEAVRHLLRVASGLDSMVLGEKQIIGQVKTAVDRARSMAMLSRQFNILSNIAIRAGKKARNETDISLGGSSISWAAIVMSESILKSLEGKSILIIGAGKMGELTLKQIQNKGVRKIYLMNRTGGEAAQTLAETCDGIAVSFEDIKEILTEVDVCVCAADAPHFILDRKMIEKIMSLRSGRELVFIDISMPRNIDPQVGLVDKVHLVCIDELDKVVQENMLKRQSAVSEVEKIIEDKLAEFYEKLNKLEDFQSVDDLLGSV